MIRATEPADLLTSGVYLLRDVRCLAGIPIALSRRFVRSYKGQRGLWGGGEQRLGRYYYVTFRDLLELRFIHAFHISGVSWQRICKTAEYARERFVSDYPFSDRRFQTDGAEIFGDTDAGLEQVSRSGQLAFSQVIGPSLFEPLDYEDDDPVRWYPAEEWGLVSVGRAIIADPLRSFGAPVISERYIPTDTLHQNFIGEGRNVCLVARTYEISEESARQAVTFEEELARRGDDFAK